MYFLGTLARIIYITDSMLGDSILFLIEIILSLFLSVFILYLFYKYRYTRFSNE